MTPVAVLAYGYLLGAPGAWLVYERDAAGQLKADWAADEPEDAYAVAAAATGVLVTARGLDAVHAAVTRPAELIRAEAAMPVRVFTWGSPSAPGVMLAALGIITDGTMHTSLYLDALATQSDRGSRAAQELEQALRVLGITPIQAAPMWHLCAATE